MRDTSCLTDREYLALYGSLSTARIESLIERGEVVDGITDDLDTARVHIEEAMGGFFAEDALQSLITRVQDLAKNLRGDNRKEAQGIAVYLENLQTQESNNADYSRDELRKARALIKKAQA